MTLIDFGEFKLRFDNKEVRISIDGDIIDVGARRDEEDSLVREDLTQRADLNFTIDASKNTIRDPKKRDKKLSNWIIYHKNTGERINAVEFTRIINSQ